MQLAAILLLGAACAAAGPAPADRPALLPRSLIANQVMAAAARRRQHDAAPTVRVPGHTRVENCGPVMDASKIVNGETVTPHEFPWVVGLLIDGGWYCGGALISDQWLLTAAHCTSGSHNIRVVAGAHRVFDHEPTQIRLTSEEIFTHPNYTPGNDIALVRLPQPLNLTAEIAPVCLPKRSSPDLQTGDMMTTMGWGTLANGYLAAELQKATLPAIDHEDCTAIYGGLNDNVVCLNTESGTGNCYGDSGGPLVWVEDGRSTTRGVTSFVGGGGCGTGTPDGDYSVKAYLDWIETTTGIIVED